MLQEVPCSRRWRPVSNGSFGRFDFWSAPHGRYEAAYGTVAGEQALDREFGIDGSIIDCPQENAQVLLVAEYVRKTERYEPRAKVARVEWTGGKAQDGTMTPKVVIEIV